MTLNIRGGKVLFGLVALLFILQDSAIAQRSRSLRCPKPGKDKTYRTIPPTYFEILGGVQMSFMYQNAAVLDKEYFKFASTPGMYAAVGANVPLNTRFGFNTGMQLALNSQGISYNYYGIGTSTRDVNYASSTLVRWCVGLSYYASPSITINAAPYLCFNSLYDYVYTTRVTGQNAIINSQSDGENGDYDTNIYPGVCLSTNIKLYRRLYLGAQGAVDFGQSPSTQVNISVFRNGQSEIATGRVEPTLAYAGLFLSYRLFERFAE